MRYLAVRFLVQRQLIKQNEAMIQMGNEDLPVSDNHTAKARAEPLLDTTLLSPTIRWSAIVLSITVGLSLIHI